MVEAQHEVAALLRSQILGKLKDIDVSSSKILITQRALYDWRKEPRSNFRAKTNCANQKNITKTFVLVAQEFLHEKSYAEERSPKSPPDLDYMQKYLQVTSKTEKIA